MSSEALQTAQTTALITNEATLLGLLAVILGGVFYTSNSQHPFWQKFYKFIPALLMCYFVPSIFNSLGWVDETAYKKLYYVATRFLLPACLVLLCISIDLKAIAKLGWRAPVMFGVGTVGIMIGGPISLLIVSSFWPELLADNGPESVWRGMATLAGSWIGGGANMTAMKEFFDVGGGIFSSMITVDVIVANIWMAVLLVLASKSKQIDAATGAETQAIEELKEKVQRYHEANKRIPELKDLMKIFAIGFGVIGFAHVGADILAPYFVEHRPDLAKYSLTSKFFWLIVISTVVGVVLSFTRARDIESVGASKVGSAFLYVLIATLGLHMDVTKIIDNPLYFLIGIIWMLVHATLMLITAKAIRAPVFFMAVGSQANVGAAASAPVVASAFHPSLAPVGVLLAVLGYAVGTFAAYLCGLILSSIGV